MSKLIDLTGNKYNRLAVISRDGCIKNNTAWLCRCDCGNTVTIRANHLKGGRVKSCGCLYRETRGFTNFKHGFYNKMEYRIWADMVQRCFNENSSHYDRYGGRGIKICNEWRENPGIFIKWLHDNKWKQGLQIDRINNDDNYCPGNCRIVEPIYNTWNKPLLSKANKSGYRGVRFKKQQNKWCAGVKIKQKDKYLGYHESALKAALYRDAYVLARGSLLPLNFPVLGEFKPKPPEPKT